MPASRPSLAAAALLAALAAVPLLPPAPALAQRSRSIITREEIEQKARNAGTAHDLIRLLRPEFLRPPPPKSIRGGGGSSAPVLYINGARSGSVEMLGSISASVVREVRYYTPAEAESRWGLGHLGGAILLSTAQEGGRRDSTKPAG